MKILMLGDFFYDYSYISKDIKEISKWINDNNYKVVLNLEGAICSEEDKTKIKKRGPNLSSNPISVEVLKKLNTIGVCLANNHIMDFSDEGLKETIELLDANRN